MNIPKRKKLIMIGIIILFFLLCIIIAMQIIVYKTEQEIKEPVFTYQIGEENQTVSLAFTPGTREERWKTGFNKTINGFDVMVPVTGCIYNCEVKNLSDTLIKDWKLRIDVMEPFYINSAWCGTVEIHQFRDGKELVQEVDLRTASAEQLQIEYEEGFTDGIMIPLEPGDYLIYLPNKEISENQVLAADEQGRINNVTSVGIILYFPFEDFAVIDFDHLQLEYQLLVEKEENVLQKVVYIALAVWINILIAVIVLLFAIHFEKKRHEKDMQIVEQSLTVFTNFVDAKDPYTNGHSIRVARYSKILALNLGMSEEEAQNVYYIGIMHDCGKVSIPDAILKKPDRLTDEEYEIIKGHPKKGAEMLESFTSIINIKEGALYHHERYDGNGYPFGLKGEEIPLIGRILGVTDAFDAMNSRRCYRDRLSREQIMQELLNNKGKQFDPKIVEVFVRLIENRDIKL